MNKIKMAIVTLALVLSLSACGGGNDTKNEDTKNETNTVETKDENGTTEESQEQTNGTGEVSYDALMAMQPSPAKDFNVQENNDGGLTITGYAGKEEMVYVPEEIDGLPVTEISKYTFANNQSPKAIRLGKNVKKVMFGAFGTNDTIEIVVAEGLEVIENSAFIESKKLKVLKLNEGLKEIQELGLSGLESLTELEIPSTVEKYGKSILLFSNENLVVKGKAGSIAEKIAKDNNVKFEAIK
ncbi:leucine-rich repeat protein [Helcococcus kunzii]|uniref:leucine-rich repeat protein n=1 Tax=Helcococcus kunzii TaxID=40091 RepID=UPI0038A30987